MNRKINRQEEKTDFTHKKQKQRQGKALHSIHQKRVSITSVMNNMQPQHKKEQQLKKETQPPKGQQKIEEKNRMIKELQEEILEKKLRNDMIQEAFSKRHESQEFSNNCIRLFKILIENCKILAISNKSFKKNLLKTTQTALHLHSKSREKGVKMILIWVISWVTQLFTFLSGTLIKK